MSSAQLASFSTCEISDALLKLNVPSGGHISDIRSFASPPDRRVCGPAYTVKMVLTSDSSAPKLNAHFVDTAPAGSVIVIDAPSTARNAVWGGLMSAGAITRGAVGVVISGRCRDIAEHHTQGFPVFARGHSTLGQSPFTRPSEINVPLDIAPPGIEGNQFLVQVSPGDWILADEDGVVCVPQGLVAEAIELAAKGRAVDELCMKDIKVGTPIQTAFQRHRGK